MKKKNIIILIVIFLIAISVPIIIKITHKPSTYEQLMEMSGDTENVTNKKTPSLKNLKEETLTFYFKGVEPTGTREYLNGLEKQAKSLNIKLDFKFIESYNNLAYLEQIRYNIKSGLPVDGIYYPTDNTYFLKSLINDGTIMSITEPFNNYAPNYLQQFSKEDLNMVSIKNKIYAIPSKNPQSNLKCAVVNENLMKKYNIPDIKSVQDLEFFLKKVKENEPGIIPLKMLSTALDLFGPASGYGIIDSSSGLIYKWDDPNMKVLAWEQTPEFRSSILKIYDWYKQGFLGEHPFTSEQINDSDIKSGKWASFIVSPDAGMYFNNMLDGTSNIKYKSYVLYPDKFAQRTSPLLSSMLVCSGSKHVERLMMFYEWLNLNQENYDSLMYGIEGKNYSLKDGNVIPIKSDKTPEYFWKYPFININLDRPMENQTREGIDEYRKIINQYTKYAPLTAFAPDSDFSGDNYYFRREINTYFEDRIETGLFNESDISTFVDGTKDQAKQLIEMVQNQLDVWKQAK